MLTQWQRLVAIKKDLDLIHQAMLPLSYRRITTAIEMISKLGVDFIVVLLIVALAAAGAVRSE